MRRVERAERCEKRVGRRGRGADPMNRLVQSRRRHRGAVEVRGDRGGRARDRLPAERVVHGVHRRFDGQDRKQSHQAGRDEPARATPSEAGPGEERHEDKRPWEAARVAGDQEMDRRRGRDRCERLGRFEGRALGDAHVGIDRARRESHGGQSQQR